MTVITYEVIVPAIIACLAFWAFTTQMIIPILRGAALFPALRRQRLELVDQVQQVDEEIEEEHIRQQLEQKRKQLEEEKHL